MFRIIREIVGFISEINSRRYLIRELTKRDFTSQYVSSVLGLWWAFLEPALFILILWFIFGVGMRSGMRIEFIATGVIPFNFFRNTLMSGISSINAYSFLINKVNMKLSILAVIKLSSNLIIFSGLFLVLLVILIVNGVAPSFYWFQSLYYLAATGVLLLGLIWLFSAIEPFFPDIRNIVGVMVQFLFYLTPIFWSPERLPASIIRFIKLNPLYYIVNGFRESFISGVGFWEHPWYTLYFWGLTLSCLVIGIVVFKKMKPHFADVVS